MPRETVPGHNHSLPTPPFFFGLGQSSTRLWWQPRVWAIPPPSITLRFQTALSKVTFVATCVVCGSMLNLPAKSGATMLLFLSFNREPAQPALNNIRQQERGSREAIATGSQLDQRRFHFSRMGAGASSTCQPILVALGALSSRSDSRF